MLLSPAADLQEVQNRGKMLNCTVSVQSVKSRPQETTVRWPGHKESTQASLLTIPHSLSRLCSCAGPLTPIPGAPSSRSANQGPTQNTLSH